MFTRVLETHKHVLHVICWLLNICLIYVKFPQKNFVKYLECIEKSLYLCTRKTKNGGTAVAVRFRKRRAERNFEKTCRKICTVQNFDLTLHSQLEKRGAKNKREYIEIMR